ncbi:MAG: T9SS type A sorting domain-containing protein, partial [Bacteroidota bacterium]
DESCIADWSIVLTGAASETLLTDINGEFSFEDLQPDNYVVSEIQQNGWVQTFPTTSGTYSIVLDNAENITGMNFGNRQQFTITSAAGANGSITPSGNILVLNGENQSFTMTPNIGYHIDSVFVDNIFIGSQENYTFNNVDAHHTIFATFAISPNTITATSGLNGTISPSGDIAVNTGSNQIFTFQPNTGYHIDSVFVDGIYVGWPLSYEFVNVSANHTIAVKFAINKYGITAMAGANGNINPGGNVVVNYGTNQQFSIVPNTGYHIDSVFVDLNYIGAVENYEFVNVKKNHKISAVFAINIYTISSSAGLDGIIDPDGDTDGEFNSDITFEFIPDEGYHVDSIFVDDEYAGNDDSYTFENLNDDHSIYVTFTINVYTLTASAGAHGMIEPSGDILLEHGESQDITITADEGYHVSDVLLDGELSLGAITEYSFEEITSNHTLTATFAINQYDLNVTIVGNGTATKSPEQQTYSHGAEVELTAIPNAHWAFSGWSGDISDTENPVSVLMESEKSIIATFYQLFPVFTSAKSVINFDTVMLGATKSDSVIITNTGDDTLLISTISSSNSLFAVTPTSGVLAPIASMQLYVTYTATNAGNTTSNVLVAHNAPDALDTIQLVGFGRDEMKFRTFKADVGLTTKAVKMKFKTGVLVAGSEPNLSSAGENLFLRIGKAGATFLGLQQTDAAQAKLKGWIAYKTFSTLQKLYTEPHTAQSYPIDSLRVTGKKSKKLSKAIVAARKTYNNPIWEQGVMLKLNLIASADSVTPKGFGNLVFDTTFSLIGRELKGQTLITISRYLDSLMTEYTLFGIDSVDSYNNLGAFASILKRINDGFYTTFAVGGINSQIDTAGVLLGTNQPSLKKNAYAVTLLGYKTALDVGLVKRIPTIKSEEFVFQTFGENVLPDNFTLAQNYPNPFNPTTTIHYSIPYEATVSLMIYDMLGREVATLVNNEIQEEGMHEMVFNATNLSSGVYFYRMNINNGEFTVSKKLLLMK